MPPRDPTQPRTPEPRVAFIFQMAPELRGRLARAAVGGGEPAVGVVRAALAALTEREDGRR